MKKVLTGRDLEALLARGGSPADVPAGAILTPSARDVLRAHETASGRRRSGSGPTVPEEPTVPDYEYSWEPGSDPQTPEEIQAFFTSPAIETLKQRMCDIGRRIWSKDYVDGNGGNLTIRVGDNLVLCTPTLISKGFMQPDEMCLVDLEGRQLAGRRKRTSEVNTHIGIFKRQPKAKACVHAHPPYATAFAVASVEPPTCLIPEAEVFLGKIALAKYETPGTAENARAIGEVGIENQAILMENHGVICWGKDIEDAYWKMENTDAYCKTVWVASQLGGLHSFGSDKLKELIAIRQQLGMDDKRTGWKECELCDNSEFRPGVVCQTSTASVSAASPARAAADDQRAEAERLVQEITDRIMAAL